MPELHVIEDDLSDEPEEWLQPELVRLEVTLARNAEFATYLEKQAA